MAIKVTREKRFHGILIPYILVVDFDVDRFKLILEEVKNVSSVEERHTLLQELNEAKLCFLKNNQTVWIKPENEYTTIFATNGFFDDTPTYPLSISNMLVCEDECSIILKSTGGWFKGVRLVLERE